MFLIAILIVVVLIDNFSKQTTVVKKWKICDGNQDAYNTFQIVQAEEFHSSDKIQIHPVSSKFLKYYAKYL